LSRQWVSDLPWPNASSEFLLAILATFVTFAAVQFLMRYAGERRRWVDLGLPVQCAVMPLTLMVAGAQNLHAMATFWYVVLAIQIAAASVVYLREVWPERRRQFWMMLGLGGAMGLAATLEFGAQQVGIDQRIVDAAQLLPPLLFMGLGLRMVQQYGRALSDAQNDRVELERRVQEAAAQIERNFAQLADMKVEQVTERERKRIAADLHDDLGAKLLTIVHTSDNERISTLAREALEEMRLSVRGLTGKPVPLLNALGDWRAEVMSRLSQAGVDGHWHSPTEEDVPQMLSARAYVQTTRILREAVSNIIKHSGASRCTVRCTIADGDFQLIVQDNGKGIPMELDGRLDRGHGMATMKHRAKQLQGQCLVESGPGYGTVIRLTLPVDRNVAPA
jgi:signal transduction histidine kinase